MRNLERRKTFAWPDIQRLIQDNDLLDYNTFLVLNGGTGVGKTSSVMRQVQDELEKKFGKSQSLLVVESRTATVDQLQTQYVDEIEKMNGVDVCQRLAFMHKIKNNAIHYDWVVIDECHGLFSEASFAEDAEFIASWIKNQREKTHIIFVTANDEYFDELSRKYFPDNYNFIYLFPDFTHYTSNTYVKEIQFIKTNRVNNVIESLMHKLRGQKGIIFLKRASEVKNWFFLMLQQGIRVGMIVSQANETTAALTPYQEKQAKDAAINISNGENGLTMADLCELYDAVRINQHKQGIREALNEEKLPDDIDVLLATDTIQEGISIKSPIQYIIIEGFTEVEVRQKLGRFRGNLNLLYIIFNPNSARAQTLDKLQIFNQLQQLYEDGDQVALAEFYGRQKAAKSTISFLIKKIDPQTGISIYYPNAPARLNVEREFHLYTRLMQNTEETVLDMYSYPLLEGAPKILSYTDDIKIDNLKETIAELAERWKGVPLKGFAQEALMNEVKDIGLMDEARHKIETFKKLCNLFKKYNVTLATKKATKKDVVQWPDNLTKLHEEYKIII